MKKNNVKKHSIVDRFNIVSINQLVFLFDDGGVFINVWDKGSLKKVKPGNLNIYEGTSKCLTR